MMKLTVNERWCFIGMLDAGMRINDNIGPIKVNEICKCSVTNKTLVHLHTFGNQKNWIT